MEALNLTGDDFLKVSDFAVLETKNGKPIDTDTIEMLEFFVLIITIMKFRLGK